MPGTGRHEKIVERVTEIYVAVFPVPVGEYRMAEVILAGYQKDPNIPNRYQVRATVETHTEAIQDLVELCDEIVEDQEEIDSYRLLKFDEDGIHILSPDNFRTFEQSYTPVRWGFC
ncbi:MAG: hypothetical protein JEZ11_17085 [Desulfobacterales bacterium]|nr:hypothetical protein [Desulfobacterales bacterium]